MFKRAEIVRFEKYYPAGGSTPDRLFVALRLWDDAIGTEENPEFEYVEAWLEGQRLHALEAMEGARGPALRNAVKAWLRPIVAEAHRQWLARRSTQPRVEIRSRSQIAESWGLDEITDLD
jgi:hypothetical protein